MTPPLDLPDRKAAVQRGLLRYCPICDAYEIRGRKITGGETREIAKGDVIIVPAGTPHWFKEVSAPFLYYVVKAR